MKFNQNHVALSHTKSVKLRNNLVVVFFDKIYQIDGLLAICVIFNFKYQFCPTQQNSISPFEKFLLTKKVTGRVFIDKYLFVCFDTV